MGFVRFNDFASGGYLLGFFSPVSLLLIGKLFYLYLVVYIPYWLKGIG